MRRVISGTFFARRAAALRVGELLNHGLLLGFDALKGLQLQCKPADKQNQKID
jgi:hypothetical protein